MTNLTKWYFIYAYALGLSFGLSIVLTALVRRLAIRFNVLDHPGERKTQKEPVPLMGGVAIVGAFFAVILGNLLLTIPISHMDIAWFELNVFAFLGEGHTVKLMGIFAGGFLIFVLGIVDDVKTLSAKRKLLGQLVAAAVLVNCGVRINLFSDLVAHGWVATALSAGVTIIWVVAITNSFNLLDNMDGLSAGVSLIAAFSFFICALHTEEAFVCVLLMIFAGSVAGFLFHNINPARIYMGDAGAMFCGYMLATISILITFYNESTPSRIAVAAPLLALSVPIFDTLSVIFIRWRTGAPIMQADRRHFSHRLVELGMSQHQAVEFIYLVAAVTGLGAALLRTASQTGTAIIIAQAVGVFCLIAILMSASNRGREGK